MKNLLPDSLGRQTFILLFVGFIIIQLAAISVLVLYFRYILHNPTHWEIANRLSQLAQITQVVPQNELEHIIRAVDSPGLHLTLADKPYTYATQISDNFASAIHRELMQTNSNNFAFSLALVTGKWINVHGTFIPSNNLILSLVAGALVLIILLAFGLCSWAVKRLSRPLSGFFTAAKRLSVDVNVAPLPEQGPHEIRLAITAFNEMQRHIKSLISHRTTILAAISHDLRTPITRLKLRVELLGETSQSTKMIYDLDEMESMIKATLAFAREDHLIESSERFDLNALLETLCNNYSDLGRPVTYQGIETRTAYEGKPLALKRVFNNIIENALKYGKSATVTFTQETQYLKISVEDQGPGIPNDMLEKVFEPFFRVEGSRSRETGGVGLGLAVAREIILAHQGTIQLKNREDGGLCVLISLVV